MKDKTKKDLLCVGILVTDIFCKGIKKMPEKGKLELMDDMKIYSGGCASNTAICASKLGLKTGLIGAIGNDIFGKFFIDEYKKYKFNLNAKLITKSNISTSSTVVIVDESGERS